MLLAMVSCKRAAWDGLSSSWHGDACTMFRGFSILFMHMTMVGLGVSCIYIYVLALETEAQSNLDDA